MGCALYFACFLWRQVYMQRRKRRKSIMRRVLPEPDQILLFPSETHEGALVSASPNVLTEELLVQEKISVVLCGTYRKDPKGLRTTFEKLRDIGFTVLSPSNVFVETEKDGFVFMRNEGTQAPDQIETRHLDAIQKANFIWFFAPDGYVGPTGALEVGFAHANGIPVFSDTILKDITIKHFVEIVESPVVVHDRFKTHQVMPPQPALRSFQHYYRRAALQRGYTKETAKDCLMLMVEEVGELARALRKRAKLVRHGPDILNQEALELADVFIYIVHMANLLKIDLSSVVQKKELINIKRLLNAD